MSDGPSWRSGSGGGTADHTEHSRQPWQAYNDRRGRDNNGSSTARWGSSWRPAQQQSSPLAELDQLDTQSPVDDTPAETSSTRKLSAGRIQQYQKRALSAQIAEFSTVAGLQQFVEQHGSQLNPVHVAQIMDTAGKQRPPRDIGWLLMDALAPIIAANAHTYPARSLCAVLRCWVHLDYRPSSKLQAVMVGALLRPECISHAPPISISLSLWAQSKLRWDEPQLVAALLQQAVSAPSEYTAQNLSNMMYALAVLGITDRGNDVNTLLEQFVAKLSDATPQELANVAWASATLRPLMRLFAAVVDAADGRAHQLNTRDISNIAWAVAKLEQYLLANTVQHMVSHMARQMRQASVQDCSNSLWALAKLQRYDERLDEVTCRALLQWVAQLLEQSPHVVKMQELSGVMYACSQLRYFDAQLLAAFEQHAVPIIAVANGRGCNIMIVALARLGAATDCPTAICALAKRLRAIGLLGDLNIQELANSCWALACLQATDQPWVLQLVQDMAGEVQRRIDAGQPFAPDNMFQLLQVSVELRVRGKELEQVSPELLERWAWSWRRQMDEESPPGSASLFQRQVLACVQTLRGVTTAIPELRTDDGLFSIDIAITLHDGRRVAVEAEGPQHYTRSEPRRLMGDTSWRDLQLRRHGWEVVNVPIWEWDLRSDEKRQEYMQQLLGITDDRWYKHSIESLVDKQPA